MKILYAPDTSDHQNWGCQLMGQAYRHALREAGARRITRIPSAWFFSANAQIPDLTRWADLRDFAHKIARGQALPELATALRECDLVFSNSENFLRPGARKGQRLLLLVYAAQVLFNKPVVLANVSLDLSEPNLAECAAEVLPLLTQVQFRESISVKNAAALLKPECWLQVPDIAWSQPAAPVAEWLGLARRPGHFNAWPEIADSFDPGRPYVTLAASSIHGLPEHRSHDASPGYLALAKRLRKEFGQVLLLAPDQPDLDIARKIQAHTGLPVLGTHFPVRQAIDVLGNARLHFGGRWHPGIFASTGGTPLIALRANTHKMQSLLDDLGSTDPVFDALNLEQEVEPILALARRKFEQGEALRTDLRARSRDLAAQIPAGMAILRDHAKIFAANPVS